MSNEELIAAVTPAMLVAAEVATPEAPATPLATPEDLVKAKMLAHLDSLTQRIESIDKLTKDTLDVTVGMHAALKALTKPTEKEKMAAADEKLKKMLAEFGGDMTVFQKALCNITGVGFMVGMVVPITLKHTVGLVLDITEAIANRTTRVASDVCKARQAGYIWTQIRLDENLREIFATEKKLALREA